MGAVTMNKTTTKSLLICIILAIGILGIFHSIPEVSATTFFSEDWSAGNFDQYPWTTPSVNRTIIDIGGAYDNVTSIGGTAPNSPVQGMTSDYIDYGAATYVHFSVEIQIKTMPDIDTSSFWGAGLNIDNTTAPEAGVCWNETYSLAIHSHDVTTYDLAALTAGSWYKFDVYVHLGNTIWWFVDDVLQYQESVSLAKEDINSTSLSWQANRILAPKFWGSGSYEVYFDNILIDDSQPPILECSVVSIPEINGGFTVNGTAYTTPESDLNLTSGDVYEFTCTTQEYDVNSSFKYVFSHWTINGSGYYGSYTITTQIDANSTFEMHYTGTSVSPYQDPIFAADSYNATFYFRSDVMTTHDELGYRLDFTNTQTARVRLRTSTGSHDISYGVRVWAFDVHGNVYELTSGVPTGIVTRSSDGEGYQSATFTINPMYTLVDAIRVYQYQRFDTNAWSLVNQFISPDGLFWKFPEATWQVDYWTNRTTSTTWSWFRWGNVTYRSRISVQYYAANPWEIALARLNAANWTGFLFTPWTYWIGDLLWAVLLLFAIVTMYARYRSLKPIIFLFWLFGGVGSFVDVMLPAIAIHVAWLMLALAMGFTFYKLLYGSR